jgi:hypothetical protein
VATNVTVHHGNVREFLVSPEGPIYREVDSTRRKTEAVAKVKAPVDTGRMRNTGASSINVVGLVVTGRVEFTAEYSIYVHEGHGVIRPKKGQYLVFRGRGGQLVYAKKVRAVAGRPFLVDALKAVSPWPVNDLS